jgi:phospholipase D1/2
LNITPAVKKVEEKSGVEYKQLQRAEAEEVMGSNIHGTETEASLAREINGKKDQANDDSGDTEHETSMDHKRRFEEQRDAEGVDGKNENKDGEPKTANSIAQNAMLGTKKVSEEPWAHGAEQLELENFVQEELYIHAKVMIADDRIVICGSSNINDRSQLGIHDSELSIVMEDTKHIESTMDGKPYQAGVHAATLRRMLWREHMGLLRPQDLDGSDDPNAQPPGDAPNDNIEGEEFDFVADPLCNKVWGMWTKNATVNTEVFRDLFHADPDNSSKLALAPLLFGCRLPCAVKTFKDYEEFTPNPKEDKEHKQGHIVKKDMPVEEIKKELDRIKGHLVWMPLDFLCEAEMAEFGLQVNQVTESIYT